MSRPRPLLAHQMTHFLPAIAFLLLLVLAACFSALETALFSLRDRRLIAADPAREKPNAEAEGLLRNPVSRLHETLLVGGVCNLLLAALALYGITGPLLPPGWSLWAGALFLFGGVLIVVEIIPKAVALRAPSRTLQLTLPLLLVLRRIFAPVASVLVRVSDAIVRRLTPRRLKPVQAMVAEEIETLIEMRSEQGSISDAEATVLQEITRLDTLTVKDCMTPRVDLPLMPHDATEEDAGHMLEGARGRFVLVFDEKADAITALVDTDAWRLAGRPAWERISQNPVLVPETMSALDALHEHLKTPASAVVIVDEYGGFEGLLGHGNIVERLIAKIAPAPTTGRAIEMLGEGRYLVSGSTRIDEVNSELDIDLTAEGVDTIGGLIFNHFGYLPKPGERTALDGVLVRVKRVGRNRITQLELRLVPAIERSAEL